jgi:nucleoside-diphosphate-sugar epimerase
MGRETLVTGATGFIGRHLVDHLAAEGWSIRALVRETSDTRHLESAGVTLIRGDLRNRATLTHAVRGVDTVFHLAAVTAARSQHEYESANSEGTRAVVDAILAADPRPRRLVYLSSYAAVGPAKGVSRPRNAEPAPLSAYGRTKLAGEYAALHAGRRGVEVVVIRAPVVYGPGDRALLPYFRLIRARLAPAPSGKDRKLHLVFAPDLVTALGRAPAVAPGAYAIADPVGHYWGDIIAAIATGLHRKPLPLPVPAPLVRSAASLVEAIGRLGGRAVPFNREKAEEMLASAWICDLTGSEALLDPAEVTPLQLGIDRTIRWYIRQGWL